MTRCPKKVRAQRGIDLGWLKEVLRAVKAAKMIAVQAGMRVLVATKPVDFRRGADSLAAPLSSAYQRRFKIIARSGPNTTLGAVLKLDDLAPFVFRNTHYGPLLRLNAKPRSP